MGKSQSRPNATTTDGNRKEKTAQGAVNNIVGTAQIKSSANGTNSATTVFASTNAVENRGVEGTGDDETAKDTTPTVSSTTTTNTNATKTLNDTPDDSEKVAADGDAKSVISSWETGLPQDMGNSKNLSINDFELLKVLGMLHSYFTTI